MAAPWLNGSGHFLFWLQKLISDPRQRSVPIGHSDQAQNTLLGTRKYSWIHPRFYSPIWRNKPRHALSLQTRSVGAQKGVFAFFPSVRRKSMKKNVKSSIFHKKTSKFLSSLPFKTQTIDNQWEYDDALANSQLIDYQILTIVNNLKYWLKTT